MRIKIATAILAVLTPISLEAAENDWISVTESSTGSVWQVRAEDILNQTNKNPHVWVKVDASKDSTVNYRERKMFAWIDCDYQTVKTVSVVSYKANGEVLDSYSNNYARSAPIVPDTVMSAVHEAVCPRAGKLDGVK